MKEELEIIISARDTYLEQVKKLKEEWLNGVGTSRFSNKRDYDIQLKIWKKRIAEYNTMIEKMNEGMGV